MNKSNELKGSSEVTEKDLKVFADEVANPKKGSDNSHIFTIEEKNTPVFPNTSEGHKMKQMWFKLLNKTFTTPVKQNEDVSIVKGRFFVEYFTEVDKITKLEVKKFKYVRL